MSHIQVIEKQYLCNFAISHVRVGGECGTQVEGDRVGNCKDVKISNKLNKYNILRDPSSHIFAHLRTWSSHMDDDSRAFLDEVMALVKPSFYGPENSVNEAVWKSAWNTSTAMGRPDAASVMASVLLVAVEMARSCFEPAERDVAGSVISDWMTKAIAEPGQSWVAPPSVDQL